MTDMEARQDQRNMAPGRGMPRPGGADAGVYPDEPAGRPDRSPREMSQGGRLEYEDWVDRSRIVLTPIAAPSVLGLFGFFAATIMVGSNLAGWWGTTSSGQEIFTFAAMFGGLAQLLAAMWSFRARDAAAVAVHGAWGSFWLAYGIQNLLVANGTLAPAGDHSVALSWWFIGLAAVTASVTLAVLADNLALVAVAGTLTAGSILAAIGYGSSAGVLTAAGYLFVISAACAWYAATAMMLASSFGRTVLPLGTWNLKGNVPLRRPMRPVEYPDGMPGVRVGQ